MLLENLEYIIEKKMEKSNFSPLFKVKQEINEFHLS